MQRVSLILVTTMVLAGCGNSGKPVITDHPEPGGSCDELGLQACTLDGGQWLVVRCSVSSAEELYWNLTRSCDEGCKDGQCLTASGDVIEAPADAGDVQTGEVTDTSEARAQPDGTDDSTLPDLCVPECTNRICGDDGCGGTCGECPPGQACMADGKSCCQPDCAGKLCGPDGCGGTCGECPEGSQCNKYNQCGPVCAPDCDDKECGPDGCGGTCGDCPPGTGCGADSQCSLCLPQCDDKECGDDGCGGSCGACPYGMVCKDYACSEPCVPVCAGKKCGDDGCGGTCGKCLPGETCIAGTCHIVCEPSCAGKDCGPDGCGGSCGKCPSWAWCSPQGKCLSDCVAPDCDGKECGDDGCGGSCGTCAGGKVCSPDGQCLAVGGGCGGVTASGWCDANMLMVCVNDALQTTNCKSVGKNVVCDWLDALDSYGCVQTGECVPDCTGKECGDDGCGGSCGKCGPGQTCDENGYCAGMGPCGNVKFEGCCEDDVVLWCDNDVLWFMDCKSKEDPAQQKCGWNTELGFYDCGATATPGPDQFPLFCQGTCVPSCANKQCGDDGCGGQCGTCPAGTQCTDFVCKGETGDCAGYSEEPVCQGDTVVWCEAGKVFFQDCTELGNYYHCGWSSDLFVYACIEEECIPDCEDKECGDNGCGYVCGYCAITEYCNDKNQCVYGQGFCGDVDYIGECDENVVRWCQNGILQEFDCSNLGPTWQCGWYEEGGYYWCLDL